MQLCLLDRGEEHMTKMQIVAKTVLNVLGIYAVVTFYRFYPNQYISTMQNSTILREILFFCAFTVFAAFITYFMIFNNGSIAGKMAGFDEQPTRQTQTVWLTTSLRIGLLFAGLMLLPRRAAPIHGQRHRKNGPADK